MEEQKKRILVVDDEPVIRLFLQELFEDEGYEVVTAQSIAEGLEAIRSTDLNLVVTDKNLPDGTGFEIVHAAREQDPPCEAMIITGYASLDSAVMALQIGAFDYVLKPIDDVDLLLEKARKGIEKQAIAAELAELRRFKDQASVDGGAIASETTAEAEPAEADAASMLATLSDDVPQLMKLAELGSMIPMLAHELRQPLAGVKGYTDLILHKKNVDEGLRGKLVSIREQVCHMADLVESLTSYSRVSNSETLVDLRSPVERALSIFPVLRSSNRYELSVNIPERLPPARASLNSLQQVLVNLLKNAKDALDEAGGGKLTVDGRFDEEAGQLRLRVEDAGPGIPADVKARLFQPFFTTKREGVGTGLGLTICRQLVQEAGGRLDVESPLRPDGGTAFTLVLPAVLDHALAGSRG
jgi:C4-dicarboxylate-specific signal transduction histidine kinase